MPVTAYAAAAARRVRDRPGVRVHVTLVSDGDVPPWRPLTAARSLVGRDGSLYVDPLASADHGQVIEVGAELAAQLDWLRQRIGPVAGMDAHTSLLYSVPAWLEAALRLCAAARIGFRLPRDATHYLSPEEVTALADAHARAVVAADELGVPLPAAMLTNRTSAAEHGRYERLRDSYLRRLSALPEGTSELFCHPGAAGPDDAATLRGGEARMLRDNRFVAALDAEGFAVVPQW